MGPPLQRCARGAACCGAPFWETPLGSQARPVGRVLQWRCAPSGRLDSCSGMGWNSRQRRRAIPLQLRPRHPSIAGPITGPIALSPGESEGVRGRPTTRDGDLRIPSHTPHTNHTHSHTTRSPACNQALVVLAVVAWTFCCARLELVGRPGWLLCLVLLRLPHLHTLTSSRWRHPRPFQTLCPTFFACCPVAHVND